MSIAQLPISAIQITGEDAETFLQGQLTCDVTKASTDKLLWASHCNLKGRMVSLGQLLKSETGFIYLVPSDIAQKAVKRLQKYVLFSKVKIEITTELIFGVWNQDAPTDAHLYSKDQFLVISEAEIETNASSDDWYQMEIQQKHAWLTAETVAKFMPAEIDLAKLGGVSLDKGCFIGQEIIARLHYLGKSKKQLVVIEADEKSLADRQGVICAVKTAHSNCHALAIENI